MHGLPMRCSASGMFAAANVNSCNSVLENVYIYSLMTRTGVSRNTVLGNIVCGDVYRTSALRMRWISQMYNF